MKKLTSEQIEWRDHLINEVAKAKELHTEEVDVIKGLWWVNDPDVLEALRYAHVTYANQPEENDTPEQQQGTEEKCCGNCTHFKSEDLDGYGLCLVAYDGVDPKSCTEMNCGDVCDKHERRSK